MLIVDTGPLVAAADRSDRHHSLCRELIETEVGPLVTSPMVIAEAAYLLDREIGPKAESALYQSIIDGGLTVDHLGRSDWIRIAVLVDRYTDLGLGGTDASVIAIAERRDAIRVATLDRRHFSVVRPSHTDGFTLLPGPG